MSTEEYELSERENNSQFFWKHPELSKFSWLSEFWLTSDKVFRWAMVSLIEASILTGFVFALSWNMPFAIALLCATILPFVPFMYARELLYQEKVIYVSAYRGPGGVWRKYLVQYLRLFNRLHSLTHSSEASEKMKAVYWERAPVIWETGVAVGHFYRRIATGENVELTSDVKSVMEEQLREFKARIDDLDSIVSSVKSLEALKSVQRLDILTTDQPAADRMISDLRSQIIGIKELNASND